MDSAALTMSQRCAWLYLRAERDTVRALAMVSEALYTPGAAAARDAPGAVGAKAASRAPEELRPPPMAYVPLCHSSGRLAPVCRVLSTEGSVFLTRERASALVCCEVTSDEHSRKLSQLFEAVRSRGKLAAELGEIVGRPEDTLALRHIKHRSTPTSSSSAASAAASPKDGTLSIEAIATSPPRIASQPPSPSPPDQASLQHPPPAADRPAVYAARAAKAAAQSTVAEARTSAHRAVAEGGAGAGEWSGAARSHLWRLVGG